MKIFLLFKSNNTVIGSDSYYSPDEQRESKFKEVLS